VHINDLADWVSEEALLAGRSAGQLVTGDLPAADNIRILPGENVAQVVPHSVASDRIHTVSFRVREPIYGDTYVKLGNLHRRKVRAAVPAEMITMKVAPRLLRDFHGDALHVHAVPAEREDAR
jgi:hypothetical protein